MARGSGRGRGRGKKQPHQQESDENVKLRAVAKAVRLQMKEMLVLNSAHRNHHSQKDAVKKLIEKKTKKNKTKRLEGVSSVRRDS